MRCYAGIGSRETPDNVMRRMTRYASLLHDKGFWLRSGGAAGADTAFEIGCANQAQIFLPERYWRGHASVFFTPSKRAYEIAERVHPAWSRCSSFAKKLHARNTHQVLGPHCDDPVEFVICWTPPDGTRSGTDQAVRIARDFDIPVYNLNDAEQELALSIELLTL